MDPQALLQPEKIIGQPSRMFPYVYAAGNPTSQLDRNGRDYVVSVEGDHIQVTLPVQLYGAATSRDLNQFRSSFDAQWGGQQFAYALGSKKYTVEFKLDAQLIGGKPPATSKPGMNSVTLVKGDNVGYTDQGDKILGLTTCIKDGTCRTASIASDRVKDKVTVPHELGHLMGLMHNSVEGNLMYESTDGPTNKSILDRQVGAILDKPMFRMPSGSAAYQTTVEAQPIPEK